MVIHATVGELSQNQDQNNGMITANINGASVECATTNESEGAKKGHKKLTTPMAVMIATAIADFLPKGIAVFMVSVRLRCRY